MGVWRCGPVRALLLDSDGSPAAPTIVCACASVCVLCVCCVCGAPALGTRRRGPVSCPLTATLNKSTRAGST